MSPIDDGAAQRAARNRRRTLVAAAWRRALAVCASFAVLTLGGIFAILLRNFVRAFTGAGGVGALSAEERALLTPDEIAELEAELSVTPTLVGDFLGSALWQPDALGEASYGVLAMVTSTLMTTAVALALAVPVGVAAASWLAFRAAGPLREGIKFGLELLAAIPSVVLGFLGIVVIGPLLGGLLGAASGLNALNGGVLLALMALPTIISISEDALASVPDTIIEGSLALGADGWQTLTRAVIPAARSGLFAAIMLGMGRAIGETMTVLMATGNAVAMPGGLLDPVRTMTATIAIELGEVAQGTTHYFMLFAVGFVLFLITLAVNLLAEWVQRRGEH